ncbi:hypothetical protein LCGC14_0531440 [marine sediment metagenome]|uniref:Uncharacterized protein n=1 Tax=marine sediment metagenome TaxID=412755 RepID=A0A0F9V3M5_9ZZZZ
MSKELKPYEKENLLLHKIKEKKAHQHRRRVEIKAIERGLLRLEATFKVEKQAYIDDLKSRNDSVDNVENQILQLTQDLKKAIPKPKPKRVVKILDGKLECDICHNFYKKSGLKSHRKACLKKIELEKLQAKMDELKLDASLDLEGVQFFKNMPEEFEVPTLDALEKDLEKELEKEEAD